MACFVRLSCDLQMMGRDDEDQPTSAQRRSDGLPGDGVAVKAGRGPGASEIPIEALGIVMGLGESEAAVDEAERKVTGSTRRRVYVDWRQKRLENQERLVDATGGPFGAIHGPCDPGTCKDWINEVFRLE